MFAEIVELTILGVEDKEKIGPDHQKYARHVERAASDLGSRIARAEALESALAGVFPKLHNGGD